MKIDEDRWSKSLPCWSDFSAPSRLNNPETMPLRSAAGPLRCAIHQLNLGCFKAAGLPAASFTSGWNFMKFLEKSSNISDVSDYNLTTISANPLTHWSMWDPASGAELVAMDDPLPKQQMITKGSLWLPSNSHETTKRLRKHLQFFTNMWP